jgi:hypothetical protein
MKTYSAHGVNEFIVCCGYKGYMIKEYFANYFLHVSDVTFDISENRMEVHREWAEPWKVTLVDTGDGTLTGGRLKRGGRNARSSSSAATPSTASIITWREQSPRCSTRFALPTAPLQ